MSKKILRVRSVNFCGSWVALGVAWHLDSGFWDICIDSFLGWTYVAYKVAQFICPDFIV